MPAAASIPTLVAQLQRQRLLRASLSAEQVLKIERALSRFTRGTAAHVLKSILDDFKGRIESALAFEEPAQIRSTLSDLGRVFDLPQVTARAYKSLQRAERIADGAGLQLSQNRPGVVEEYPALEFKRLMQRDVPRGASGRDDDLDWFERWARAAEFAADEDYTAASSGRLVALKSSDIWNWLGSPELFPDGTGLNHAPFAWESGWSTVNRSRAETEELGLLAPGESAAPAAIDLEKLFPDFTEVTA